MKQTFEIDCDENISLETLKNLLDGIFFSVEIRKLETGLLDFSAKNLLRCEESFHPLNEWSPTDYGCAMSGEAGECNNFLKKMRRISVIPEAFEAKIHFRNKWAQPDEMYPIFVQKAGLEIADTVIYSDLLATRLGLSLGALIIKKFNQDSDKIGSRIKL